MNPDAPNGGIESSAEIELRGLSIYTHHGVSDAEQEVGQRLEFDISFDVPDCDAVLTDRLDDTVDYGAVCDIVALAATERSYRTLERLSQVVGERLMERYGCESVRVRAAKPEPPLPLAIQAVAAEVVHVQLARLEAAVGPGGVTGHVVEGHDVLSADIAAVHHGGGGFGVRALEGVEAVAPVEGERLEAVQPARDHVRGGQELARQSAVGKNQFADHRFNRRFPRSGAPDL